MVATYEDANLLVQLMRWGTEIGLNDALKTIFDEGFDPETEPMDSAPIRAVLTFGEMAGALVKHNVLNRDLLRDFLWIDGIWPQVSKHVMLVREQTNEQSLYEHFEALVTPSAR
jgi:hypothetical protein